MLHTQNVQTLENLVKQPIESIEKQITTNKDLINSKGRYGRSLLHFACINNRLDVVNLLSRLRADFSIKSNSNKNCLHYACEYGMVEIIIFLIRINPMLLGEQDNNEKTPVQLATENQFSDKIIISLINEFVNAKIFDACPFIHRPLLLLIHLCNLGDMSIF
jgi:ankyrin repeat protein